MTSKTPYEERCQAKTVSYRTGARGSRLYKDCSRRATWTVEVANPSIASPDRVDRKRMCGHHKNDEQRLGLLKNAERISV